MGQRKEEQRADRIVEIIEAAVKLFAKKGYHATSISDISEAVGLERGALYYSRTCAEITGPRSLTSRIRLPSIEMLQTQRAG